MKKITPLTKAILIGLSAGLILRLVSCAVPVAIPLIKADAPEVVIIEEKEIS